MLSWFIRLNKAICDKIEGWLPDNFTRSLLYLHELTAARLMNNRSSQRIVDVGGGYICPFAMHKKDDLNAEIISIDISKSQLLKNKHADHCIVGDASASIPLMSDSVDMIVTRSVLEHLRNNIVFARESSRVLRRGGYGVHVFPCKFAPFAIINRMLPVKLAQRILYYTFPEWKDECGFPAFYDECFYPGMINVLEKEGFEIEEIHFRYYQSIYFKFFLPLYLVFLFYDLLLWSLSLKPLSCQMLVVAKRL